MTGANEISQLLYRARSERSGQKALAFLRKALEACKEWSNSEANPDALLFEAQTRAELAIELAVPAQRATQWRASLALLKNRVFNSPNLQRSRALAFASIAVDSFQDRYSSQAAADQVQHLPNAERYLSALLTTPFTDVQRGPTGRRRSQPKDSFGERPDFAVPRADFFALSPAKNRFFHNADAPLA